ncbi:hypothetical protein [Nostoc sp.]
MTISWLTNVRGLGIRDWGLGIGYEEENKVTEQGKSKKIKSVT